MTKQIFYFLLTLLTLQSLQSLSAQPVVYFDFVSHNEETAQWNGAPYYAANRARLISLANTFQAKGVSWNLQSDWVFLTNVLNQETPAMKATTNGKNILRWMYEDKGVEMDPHAHESQYLYPDVVKLMDSIGLPESKVIGGTIYNDHNGLNIWTNLDDGQYGVKFPGKFWRPDFMMGGGTPNHVDDVRYFGLWNPRSPSDYLTHDTSTHLHHIGLGCEMKVETTTAVSDVVTALRRLLANVQSGAYPADGFYAQSIFFEQGDLNNPAFYAKIEQIADSISAMVATGAAQWKTLKQIGALWEGNYHARPFQWECSQVTGSGEPVFGSHWKVAPNPFSSRLEISGPYEPDHCSLFNALGQVVWTGGDPGTQDFSWLTAGCYWLRVEVGAAPLKVVKL